MKTYLLSKLTSLSLFLPKSRSFCTKNLDILPEVKNGIASGKPVVALESTIITHGMPFPLNLQTALEVEEIVRSQGATPATVAILHGRIKVGLTERDLKYIASPETSVIKSSRRDIPYVVSKNLNGGTTVSGTLLVCSLVGIKIFVTGGIGGVHRDGHITLDISADLNELGRHSIAVISSGIKSILDIERTLEYLESQGVCVATFGETNDFPAFYTRSSGFKSQYNVNSVTDAAKLVQSLVDLDSKSGMLLAVPVPKNFELIKNEEMEKIIQSALSSADLNGVKGKEVTPFLLDKIKHITEGKSLKTNIALIKNNALVGSQIAVELSKLNESSRHTSHNGTPSGVSGVTSRSVCRVDSRSSSDSKMSKKQVVVVGGSMVDLVVKAVEDIKTDGRTIGGKVQQMNGGVGRNLADAIGRLIDVPPIFISAVGNDDLGKSLLADIPHVNTKAVILSEKNTACANVLIDKTGECIVIVADMDVHQDISPDKAKDFEDIVKSSNFIVFDGNLSLETMSEILQISGKHNIPVFYEPTDITTAMKPFKTKYWRNITYISPNLNELLEMSRVLNKSYHLNFDADFSSEENIIQKAVEHALLLTAYIPTIIVTVGMHGVVMLSRAENDGFSDVKIHHYKSLHNLKVVNVSGAGDSLAAGFIAGLIRGHSESEAMAVGLSAAALTLQSERTVSESLKWIEPVKGARFTTLNKCDFNFNKNV